SRSPHLVRNISFFEDQYSLSATECAVFSNAFLASDLASMIRVHKMSNRWIFMIFVESAPPSVGISLEGTSSTVSAYAVIGERMWLVRQIVSAPLALAILSGSTKSLVLPEVEMPNTRCPFLVR